MFVCGSQYTRSEYRNNHHLHDTMPVRIHPKSVSHMFEYRRHVYKFYPTCVTHPYMYTCMHVCDNHYLICPKQQYVGSLLSPYGSTTHSLIIKKKKSLCKNALFRICTVCFNVVHLDDTIPHLLLKCTCTHINLKST